ncbi:MAG: hypothetical protein KDJ52_01735 [Anaerolineae bacterium]|nr:hypothetical protein [Anaerolineae bacterium]
MSETERISLKEFLEVQFRALEKEMNAISTNQVDKTRFDTLRLQVASLSEGIQDLEKRLDTLEDHDAIGMWAFKIITGISTALLIGWLSGWFS